MNHVPSYGEWIRRAEAFARGTHHLPGTWNLSIAIGPPVSEAEIEETASQVPYGLPPQLRRLYTEGAGHCRCSFYWEPERDQVGILKDVFPEEVGYAGGPEFISWSDLPGEARFIQTWWDGLEIDGNEEQLQAREIWSRTTPFIRLPNGDFLGLHRTGDPDRMPVVYLCHDDPDRPVTHLSPSFDAFLEIWETLCYPGPEIWLLRPFLGEDERGPLRIDPEQAARLRKVLQGPS